MVKKNENSLLMLNLLFAVSVVVSNIIASKIVKLGWFITPAAVFLYAATYLFTDIIDEIWGKKEAQKAVVRGFWAQVLATIAITIGRYLPVAPFTQSTQEHYIAIMGQSWRMFVASMLSYWVSQTIDVYLFAFWGDLTRGKHKWLRNNGSTIVSQFFDTTIFITIAFLGTVPNNVLWQMIVSQYSLKFIIALCDTPFFYLFTKGHVYKPSKTKEEYSAS